jgi:hypothetical protein
MQTIGERPGNESLARQNPFSPKTTPPRGRHQAPLYQSYFWPSTFISIQFKYSQYPKPPSEDKTFKPNLTANIRSAPYVYVSLMIVMPHTLCRVQNKVFLKFYANIIARSASHILDKHRDRRSCSELRDFSSTRFAGDSDRLRHVAACAPLQRRQEYSNVSTDAG